MLTGDQILQCLQSEALNFSDIARLLSVTPQHVRSVAHRDRNSLRIAKALAIAIGVPFKEVFSDQPQYFKVATSLETRAKKLKAAQAALLEAGCLSQTATR